MKTVIDMATWPRKQHFDFFSSFQEPFFGITTNINCSLAYQKSKKAQQSFFLYYLYRALKAANIIENFRFRIMGSEVYCYDKVMASPTINKPNGTFGFAYLDYFEDEQVFLNNALEVIEKAKASDELIPALAESNVIHCSALPWINFTSLSHARNYTIADSCPKISFGKVFTENEEMYMAVSIHVHHGLMDGVHVGQYVELFQNLMNEE